MSETLGGLVDKLVTVDMKMWHNQEFLYAVRRMTFGEFSAQYLATEEKTRDLFDSIKRCCDLNYQRNELINEINEYFASSLESVSTGGVDRDRHVQKPHKTY